MEKGFVYCCAWFNRTFMELKHIKAAPARVAASGFNRTFMELKHGKADVYKPISGRGLIVPLMV